VAALLRKTLVKGVEAGTLVRTKGVGAAGSFKLPATIPQTKATHSKVKVPPPAGKSKKALPPPKEPKTKKAQEKPDEPKPRPTNRQASSRTRK
jgi:histone H1/5